MEGGGTGTGTRMDVCCARIGGEVCDVLFLETLELALVKLLPDGVLE